MKRSMRWVALGLYVLLPMLFGCGGDQTSSLVRSPAVTVSPTAAVLGAFEKQQFTAAVTNTSNLAVTWTLADCSGDACGTISTDGLYTAPGLIVDQATVTVIATLQENSMITDRAAVTHMPLSLQVSPAQTLSLGAGATQAFTTSVAWHFDSTVLWSLSGTGCTGEGCGTLTDITATSATYHAPATVPNQVVAMVKATSSCDKTKSQSANINLMPVSVSVIPGPEAMVAPSGTRNFRAVVQYDPLNAGVTWKLSGNGCSGDDCGTLAGVTSTSAVYHAPATPPGPLTVTLTVTSVTDAVHSATSTITVSSESSALQGKYAFLIRGYHRLSGTVTMETMAGHFQADGSGNLIGVWDANRGPAPEVAQSITGSYAIHPDGRGTMTIESGTAWLTFNLTMDATGASARLAESTLHETESGQTPDVRGSSGIMVRQDPNSFALSSVQGDRVLALFGYHTGSPLAVLGRFTASPTGGLSRGVADLTWRGNTIAFTNTTQLAGSFLTPNASTGRGTASLATIEGTFNFAYYIVSERRIVLAQTDAPGLNMRNLSGEVRRQNGADSFTKASLNAPVVFSMAGEANNLSPQEWSPEYPAVAIGKFVPDGAGSLAAISDENEDGYMALNAANSGSYAVEANGRVTLTLPAAVSFGHYYRSSAIAYLTDQNSGYLMREGLWGPAFGSIEAQTGGPFDLHALSGTFLFNTDFPPLAESLNSSGLLKLDENGKVDATLSGSLSDFSGTLNLDSNGRATLTLATSAETASGHIVIWAISPEHCVALVKADPGYTRPTLVHLERWK